MSFVKLPFAGHPLNPLTVLIALTLVFGTLDIADALLFWGVTMDVGPTHIFQGIASGLLGSAAFHGSIATAALGAVIHYCGFLCLLGIYYLVLMRFPALGRRPYAYGLIYGLLTYSLIHSLILPLSAYHIVSGFYLAGFLNSFLAQIAFVGIASGFLAHELHSKEKRPVEGPTGVQHASPSR